MKTLNKLHRLKYLLKEEYKTYRTYKRIYEANSNLKTRIENVEKMLTDNPEINSLMNVFSNKIAQYLSDKGYEPEEVYSLNESETIIYNYVDLLKTLQELINFHVDNLVPNRQPNQH